MKKIYTFTLDDEVPSDELFNDVKVIAHLLYDDLKEQLIHKYMNSSDEDIKKIVAYYKKNTFNLYGVYPFMFLK